MEKNKQEKATQWKKQCRVREIAYGFGGPSEKNVSPH
jgi:hypothetical protein